MALNSYGRTRRAAGAFACAARVWRDLVVNVLLGDVAAVLPDARADRVALQHPYAPRGPVVDVADVLA